MTESELNAILWMVDPCDLYTVEAGYQSRNDYIGIALYLVKRMPFGQDMFKHAAALVMPESPPDPQKVQFIVRNQSDKVLVDLADSLLCDAT